MIKTTEDFTKLTEEIEQRPGYSRPVAFGLGVRRIKGEKVLDVTFPLINFKANFGTAAILFDTIGFKPETNCATVVSKDQLKSAYNKFAPFHHDFASHQNVALLKNLLEADTMPPYYGERDLILYVMYNMDKGVDNATEAYFKLQCISQRLVKPHELCLDGVFGKLNNIAWTNKGPILVEDIQAEQTKALLSEPLRVSHVDKFPYMINYTVPAGTRVVAGSQVRLGAHLGEGTTVMPAGYINFNAGTLGNAMIEGRVSGGVVVDKDSDIGGGASIMGTLSGGNSHVISIGSKCLMGANAGTGISLGDGCTIGAGAYITAGSKISYYNENGEAIDLDGKQVTEGENVFKGALFSGRKNLLFLVDSQSGKITARPNPKMIQLNEDLHAN